MSIIDARAQEASERIALGPKPEGAEMRFSEYVVKEVLAGRFKRSRFWGKFDDYSIYSQDADRYRYDLSANDPYSAAEYDKKVFSLTARRTWFGRGKPRVHLERGLMNITNLLAPFEVANLAEAYFEAEKIYAARQTQKQIEAEAKRQRAAWWP